MQLPDSIFVKRLSLGGMGPTVAIKDTIDIAGCTTKAGSRALDDAAPSTSHATVVQALLGAGCRIVGKTNLHELAYGVTGVNLWTGTPPNPKFPDYLPGGSSSGSAAAVAAGLADIAIGTDTGGSIRTPATCCGVFGLKPTFGRIDRTGAHPAASSLDCIGPFARSMALIEQAMQYLDPAYRPRPSPDRLRIGRVATNGEGEIEQAIDHLLSQAGVETVPVDLPSFDEAFGANIAIIGAETWAAFGHLIATGKLGHDVESRLRVAGEIAAPRLDAAEAVRVQFRNEVDAALSQVDALALPAMPRRPLRVDEPWDAGDALQTTAFQRQFNLSGHPVLAIPVPSHDIPIGLQLVGRSGEDEALCSIGRVIAERLAP